MSILAFLKKSKLPSFEDDFIQDQTEKAMDESPVAYGSRVICDSQHEIKAEEALNDPWDKRCRVLQRHHDPSDPTSLSSLNVWEDS